VEGMFRHSCRRDLCFMT